MRQPAIAQAQLSESITRSNAKGLAIQRKCACGQHTVAGSECEECRKKRLQVQRWRKNHAGPSILSAVSPTAAPGVTSNFGVDFTRVQLRTSQPTVQRMPRDGIGFTPGEMTGQAVEAAATTESAPIPAETTPEPAMPGSAPAEPTTEPVTPGDTAVSGLLVEDEATELGEGQMRKSEFLAELRTAVCAAADAELAAAGRNTEGCPYLDYWFDYYSQRDAAHGERALRRYAPGAATATSAREYIPIVAARVRQGVARWVSTGEISGMPEGVPTAVPGEPPPAESGQSNSAIQFKAREGGARLGDDPAAIRDRLGHGRALDSGVRSRMESAFGTSFGHVRLHNDSNAANLSHRQNARAFTVGEHVAFGAGEYQPGTMLGDALIAHELAHVVQQGSATESLANMEVGDAGYAALERDADRTAVSVLASFWQSTKEGATSFVQTAMPQLRSGLRLQRCCRDDQGQQYTQKYRQYGAAAFEASPYCACSPKQPCADDRRTYRKKPDGSSWKGLEVEYKAECLGCSTVSETPLDNYPCEETVGCR